MKPEITIHNIETNEVTTREMTDEEFSRYEAELAADAALKAEAEAKAAAKQAILDRLGMTAEEAALLVK